MELGTVLNVNSKTSPGNSSIGRSRHARTTRNVVRVAAVMNRDAAKQIGARHTSPVSSARRNSMMLGKSSWSRISTDMKYHPYWPIRREELKPEDLPRRIQFCTWIFNQAKMANLKLAILPLFQCYEPLFGFNRSAGNVTKISKMYTLKTN